MKQQYLSEKRQLAQSLSMIAAMIVSLVVFCLLPPLVSGAKASIYDQLPLVSEEFLNDELLNSPNDFVMGNPNGSITIVEFFDYRCTYCKIMIPRMEQLMANDKSIRFVIKDFPVLGANSNFAARFAIAARQLDRNKMQKFFQLMSEQRGGLNPDEQLNLAVQAGYNLDSLAALAKDKSVEKIIKTNLELGRKLGISGTPGFVIGNRLIPGAISFKEFETVIKIYKAEKTKSLEQSNLSSSGMVQ